MAHSQSSTCSSSVASTQESAPIGGNSGGLSTQSIPVDCESKQGKDGKTFRSPMWKHFTHLVVNNEEKAQCNYCKKLFVGKSSYGTSHLKQHFDRCPRRKAAGGDIRKMILKTDSKGNVNSSAFNEKHGIEKLAKMIILHDYPLSMVEHRGFRDFTTTMQPLFKCPCRNTMKKHILNIYGEERDKVMKLIENNDSRVAITTGMWTSSNQKRGFMSVTAHFIDKSWTLHSLILRYNKLTCSFLN